MFTLNEHNLLLVSLRINLVIQNKQFTGTPGPRSCGQNLKTQNCEPRYIQKQNKYLLYLAFVSNNLIRRMSNVI